MKQRFNEKRANWDMGYGQHDLLEDIVDSQTPDVVSNDNVYPPVAPYYLASPYSRYPLGLDKAYEHAAEMLMFLLKNDIFTFSPIVHSHAPSLTELCNPDLKHDYEFWLNIDFKYIRLSPAVIVCKMDGWDQSYGIRKEIEFCTKINKPIYYTNFLELPKELRKL